MSTKSLKSLFAASAFALAALAAAPAHALFFGTASFQGVTFTFTQLDADSLKFELSGTTPLTGDWATAQFFGAFDLKDLGINFSTATGTANGPGAVNLVGLNSQLSASSVDCLATGAPLGSICFDIAPDVALGAAFDFIYTIDFSAPLNIASTGPHLQVDFSATQNGDKVGSLYSLNIPSTSSGGGGGGGAPEPSSSALALLGLALLGGTFLKRKMSHRA